MSKKKETMTVTKGLRELKLIESRIMSGISNLGLLDTKRQKFGDRCLNSNLTTSEFMVQEKGKLVSVESLIERRQAIKSAIMKSNLKAKVKVNGKSMIVAEAIDYKKTIEFKKYLLERVKSKKDAFDRQLSHDRETLDAKIDQMLQTSLGTDRKKDGKEHEMIVKPFLEANELKLVDPVNVNSVINRIEKEIETFLSDIDIALSESNALTEIQI